MKQSVHFSYLPLIPPGLGLITLLLRLKLYSLEEPSGLLPRSHPLHIASLIVTLCAAGLILWFAVTAKGSARYSKNFPASFPAALCIGLSALWMLPVAFASWGQEEGLFGVLWTASAFLSVISLLAIAWCRWQNRRPHFLLHAILCLYFIVHMICYYRHWSAMPQLENYLFPLFGSVFLALTAYYRANFDIRCDQRRRMLFFAYLAVYFCVASLAGPGEKAFYFAGALWALTDVCTAHPQKNQEEPGDVSA